MGCVKKGDKVKVDYIGRLEDGTIFDSSEKHNAPLEFIAGGGQLIKGFEEAVIGMNIGEEKEIKIPPEEAYGMPNPDFVKEVPRDCFPPEQEIAPGMVFVMKTENGKQIPLRIALVSDDKVTVDLNPPLAGKTLIFKIKLLDIII